MRETVPEPESGCPGADVAAREAHVLGQGPRIEAIPNEEVSQDAWDLVDRIRASAGAGKAEVMPEYMRLMLKHPPIFRCQMEMGTALFQGLIPARERELAVLRIAWLCRAPYEWGQHVDIAKRYGLAADEIERVIHGSGAHGWTEHEASLLRGVEELLGDHALSDSTYVTLARSYSEAQMIEYLMMVGQYVATAFIQNSLRVRLSEGNPGLRHR